MAELTIGLNPEAPLPINTHSSTRPNYLGTYTFKVPSSQTAQAAHCHGLYLPVTDEGEEHSTSGMWPHWIT